MNEAMTQSAVPQFRSPEEVLYHYARPADLWFEVTERALQGSPEGLSSAQCQLVAAFTSGLNACDFCYRSHTALADALGVDLGLIEAAVADVESAPCDEVTRALLRFVRKLNQSPGRVGPRDAEEFLAAGWNDVQYFDAVQVCALFNYFNRLTQAFDLELPTNFREMLHVPSQ